MHARTLPRALLAAALLLAPQLTAAQMPVPPLKSRITDVTGALSSGQIQTLEQTLAAFEARKGVQVAVLIVPTTQPETVEHYAARVFDEWKLGHEGVGDGVLLAIAKNDRRLRIEISYGLESVLDNPTLQRIIDEEIVPRFKQGDFYEGVSAGVEHIMEVIDHGFIKPGERAQRITSLPPTAR
jgi:uncharacterized protein